jgi:hypothetical protein
MIKCLGNGAIFFGPYAIRSRRVTMVSGLIDRSMQNNGLCGSRSTLSLPHFDPH